MRKGTTKTGFPYELDESAADDMRLVDALSVCMSDESDSFEKISAASRAAELLLGSRQKKALYDHIGQSHGGRVPAAELMNELEDIMSGSDAEKNS